MDNLQAWLSRHTKTYYVSNQHIQLFLKTLTDTCNWNIKTQNYEDKHFHKIFITKPCENTEIQATNQKEKKICKVCHSISHLNKYAINIKYKWHILKKNIRLYTYVSKKDFVSFMCSHGVHLNYIISQFKHIVSLSLSPSQYK